MKKIPGKIVFPVIIILMVIITSSLMHAPHMGKDLMGLHVWRQTQTQSTVINFYEEDFNILNPRRNDRGNGDGIFRMEFPLMQWLVAGTYKIFGNHLVISRIWMLLTGFMTVIGMYFLIRAVTGSEIPAVAGAWAINFSPSFYYYTINPMPDNLALCFGAWGLALFVMRVRSGNKAHFILSGIFMGLSALVKLPFILYFTVPAIYFLVKKNEFSFIKKSAAALVFTLPALIWYLIAVPHWKDNGIVGGILQNQAPFKVLAANFTHHLFINLPELLLNYGAVLPFLAAFYFMIKRKSWRNSLFMPFAFLAALLCLYILFELNMVGKSHDYYLFPFLPLLFILVGYGFYRLISLKSYIFKIIAVVALLVLPLTAYLRIDGRWNPAKPGFNKDLLIYRDELRGAVPDDALCVAGSDLSHFIFFYYIDKKGWGFDYDHLEENDFREMIKEGAKYLYSDSRKAESSPGIAALLDGLVMEKGSIRVYKLKGSLSP